MRLLLDTHIYLWAATNHRSLSRSAKQLILEADDIFVSAASIWEATIKSALGKLDADPEALVRAITASGFAELPVRAMHAAAVRKLPGLHRDPFDRLLIAQAISEPLHFLTSDRALAAYSKLVIVT